MDSGASPASDAAAAEDATPSPAADPNGVQQIYPTNPGGAPPWTLGYGDWEARIHRFQDIQGAGRDTVVTAGDQVRLTVKAEPTDCEGDPDQGAALARGWMCSPADWRNFEMTGYVQLVTPSVDPADQDWTWYGNGGRHTGTGPTLGCLGSSYKGSYQYATGEARVAKESWHVNYAFRPWQPVAGGIDYTAQSERWLGMKLVRYQVERDGEPGVRLEIWLDLAGVDAAGAPANAWFLARVEEDHPSSGSFGTQATACGCPIDDQVMLWGGPWVTWRWDGTTSRIRLMSVREIVPPVDIPPP